MSPFPARSQGGGRKSVTPCPLLRSAPRPRNAACRASERTRDDGKRDVRRFRVKKITIGLIAACLLIMGFALHYALPRVSVVDVVGVEVKRIDEVDRTRDVYMIQTQSPDGSAVRVFRNEDAWLYFKLDSANLQARATAFARAEGEEAVAIRYYGWRIPILSMFPSAIDAWPVEPGYRHIPYFNMTVIAPLLVGTALAWRAIRRVTSRVAEARARRADRRARAENMSRATASRTASDDADRDWLLQDWPAPGSRDTSGRGE